VSLQLESDQDAAESHGNLLQKGRRRSRIAQFLILAALMIERASASPKETIPEIAPKSLVWSLVCPVILCVALIFADASGILSLSALKLILVYFLLAYLIKVGSQKY